MLFENLNQYQKAKQTLLENERDIDLTVNILKQSPLFSNLSEGEIISGVSQLNEGLGDTIANFIGGAFGGDISKIKTVLTQMKEQELKFNREEYEIYNEFYRTLEDQKALEKDKNNPSYQALNKDIMQYRNGLNMRMKELTKSHNEIFNALESKIKDLVGDNKRKKKYFNAQRATDVLETRNDRYEKIKSVTARSASRSSDLESFFGVTVDDAKKDADDAKTKANKAVENLEKTQQVNPSAAPISKEKYSKDPQKSFFERFDKIRSSVGGFYSKRNDLTKLRDDIYNEMISDGGKKHDRNTLLELNTIFSQVENLYTTLEKEEMKAK
jgi:predicted  nucleic acid-binding Zn-ribbon protein